MSAAGNLPGAAPSQKPRKGGVVKPNEPGTLQVLGSWVLYLFIRATSATIRYRLHDPRQLLAKGKRPAIFCVWHNRLALCIPIYKKFACRESRTPGMAAMASASKDGAFLVAVLARLGVHAARGSSSRRGPQALLELTSYADKGYDLAITPDGPRGPLYHVQPGVISLAQVTALPIISCTYNLSWKLKVKSWDRFQIPLPFSRCDVFIGELLEVPRSASEDEREGLRLKLEQALSANTRD